MPLPRDRFSYEPSTGVVGWKAWYTNNRFYSSATSTWTILPNFGVLVIMLYFADGTRRVMGGTEYYVWDANGFNHKPVMPTAGEVKRAPVLVIPEADFNVIYDTAMADYELP